jgi:hypothetical protein
MSDAQDSSFRRLPQQRGEAGTSITVSPVECASRCAASTDWAPLIRLQGRQGRPLRQWPNRKGMNAGSAGNSCAASTTRIPFALTRRIAGFRQGTEQSRSR